MMNLLLRSGVPLAIGLLAAATHPSVAQTSRTSADPVTSDPTHFESDYPPAAAELALESGGSRLNGFLYLAAGKAPHPTVLLLHGFPGNERNGDLAQTLRRAGMNVLLFDYRGNWGSGGTFSFGHTLEDVGAAIAFIRSDSSRSAFRVDPRRIILAGHSMGGWLALMGTAADSSIACAVALDFWNTGYDGQQMRTDHERDSSLTAYVALQAGPGGPIRAASVESVMDELREQGDRWNPERAAAAIGSRPVLIVSTTENRAHPRLVSALRAVHAPRLEAVQWKTDHSFSDRRVQLARKMVDWLRRSCGG
jgi:dipeptidyl aminopeptidase/acylaminoacyl peptidase